ncbi:DMT family transporter [uncultured Acidaminococcus sp.]|uniref:DMT family transporter n=1 Tax=uncultured Acidaminococcus sp. TaxID=352152 RepID=UPI00266EDBBD|nr:DMT family transporter [uncultured Acidaminococcus sp.]
MPRLPALSGSALVLLGAVCWSLNSPLVKYLTLDPFLICGLRSLIAGLVLLPFVRPREIAWNRYLLAYVLAYCVLCLSVIVSLSLTSAAIAIGMQYTATIWLFLLYWFQTRYFSRRAFLPVAVIMAGVLCFMLSGGSGDSHPLGNLIALTEGIFFAGMSLASKKATRTNALGITAIGNLFTALAVFLLFPTARAALPAMNGQEWGMMLILGMVQVAGGYGFFNLGVQKIPARKASVLALWEMILGPLWVALFLHQYPGPMVLAGFAIILAGMVLDAKGAVA